MLRRAGPDEETTNWRAVCGRTARTVRREGRETFPTPIQRVGQGRLERSGKRHLHPMVMCFLLFLSLVSNVIF